MNTTLVQRIQEHKLILNWYKEYKATGEYYISTGITRVVLAITKLVQGIQGYR